MDPILKNQFVTEYVGEVLTNEEAEERGKIYDHVGQTYLFDLDYNEGECAFTIDAKKYGNISHFINHSVSQLLYFPCTPLHGINNLLIVYDNMKTYFYYNISSKYELSLCSCWILCLLYYVTVKMYYRLNITVGHWVMAGLQLFALPVILI